MGTNSPLVCGSKLGPHAGKLVVDYNGQQFIKQNLDQLYVFVLSAHKTIACHDMTYAVLKVTLNPKKTISQIF